MGCDAGARVDDAARRTPARCERSRRYRRRRWCGARPRRRAALRRGTVDGLYGRSLVALAHAAAVVRSFVRHVLAAGGAVAAPWRDRSRGDCRFRGRSTRGHACRCASAVRDAAFVSADRRDGRCAGDLARGPHRNASRRRHPRRRRATLRTWRGSSAAARGCFRIGVEAPAGTATVGSASAAMLVGGADLEMTDPRLNTPGPPAHRAGVGRTSGRCRRCGRDRRPLRAGAAGRASRGDARSLAHRLVVRRNRRAARRRVAACGGAGGCDEVRAIVAAVLACCCSCSIRRRPGSALR